MFNPILNEIVANQQYNDRLKLAEQSRLAKAAAARQGASRSALRTAIRNLVMAALYLIGVR